MITLNYSISINAPKEKVWKMLWSDESYRQWTSVFSEGSYARSEWQEGSKIQFLSPKGNGMYGIIKRKVDNEQMSFEHHGEIKDGKEEKKDWAGATENYYLQETDGRTELSVHLDATEEFRDYFNNTFPKALEELKRICEQ